jgi:hypothetical protein
MNNVFGKFTQRLFGPRIQLPGDLLQQRAQMFKTQRILLLKLRSRLGSNPDGLRFPKGKSTAGIEPFIDGDRIVRERVLLKSLTQTSP